MEGASARVAPMRMRSPDCCSGSVRLQESTSASAANVYIKCLFIGFALQDDGGEYGLILPVGHCGVEGNHGVVVVGAGAVAGTQRIDYQAVDGAVVNLPSRNIFQPEVGSADGVALAEDLLAVELGYYGRIQGDAVDFLPGEGPAVLVALGFGDSLGQHEELGQEVDIDILAFVVLAGGQEHLGLVGDEGLVAVVGPDAVLSLVGGLYPVHETLGGIFGQGEGGAALVEEVFYGDAVDGNFPVIDAAVGGFVVVVGCAGLNLYLAQSVVEEDGHAGRTVDAAVGAVGVITVADALGRVHDIFLGGLYIYVGVRNFFLADGQALHSVGIVAKEVDGDVLGPVVCAGCGPEIVSAVGHEGVGHEIFAERAFCPGIYAKGLRGGELGPFDAGAGGVSGGLEADGAACACGVFPLGAGGKGDNRQEDYDECLFHFCLIIRRLEYNFGFCYLLVPVGHRGVEQYEAAIDVHHGGDGEDVGDVLVHTPAVDVLGDEAGTAKHVVLFDDELLACAVARVAVGTHVHGEEKFLLVKNLRQGEERADALYILGEGLDAVQIYGAAHGGVGRSPDVGFGLGPAAVFGQGQIYGTGREEIVNRQALHIYLPAGNLAGGGHDAGGGGPQLEGDARQGMTEERGHALIAVVEGVAVAGQAGGLVGIHHIHSLVCIHIPGGGVADAVFGDDRGGGVAAVGAIGRVADKIQRAGAGPEISPAHGDPAAACLVETYLTVGKVNSVVLLLDALVPCVGAEGDVQVRVLVVGVIGLGEGAVARHHEGNLARGLLLLYLGAGR